MSKVFFKPLGSRPKDDEISRGALQVLDRLLTSGKIELKSHVPLKVHFGEKGNQTFIASGSYKGIIEFLKSKKVDSAFIESNVLYNGERQNRTSHLELARNHGFTMLPVVIADGEFGEEYSLVSINGNHFDNCLIAKGIAALEQMIVMSHFKGHMLSGFGGAVKQLAMGCASRGGKLAQHANTLPRMKPRKCKACGECVEKCPARAISIDPRPVIDENMCLGCASCVAVCKEGAISFTWWASFTKKFHERMAEYALAAQKDKSVIYINFLVTITRGCDCMGRKMKPVTPDIGILASTDPVAIDSASLDLVQKGKGRKIFQRGRRTLEYSEKIGLGKRSYLLEEI